MLRSDESPHNSPGNAHPSTGDALPLPPSRRRGEGPPSKKPLAIGLVAAVAVGLIVAGLLTFWPSTRGKVTTEGLPSAPPTVASDSCSVDGFKSLLPGLDADQLSSRGDPRCEGSFAVLPLGRSTGAGIEYLVAVFDVGPGNAWEHFATVQAADCPDLAGVKDGFPIALCTA